MVVGVLAAIVAAAGIGVFAGGMTNGEPTGEAKKAAPAEPHSEATAERAPEKASAAEAVPAGSASAAAAPLPVAPLDANACAKATLPDGTLGSSPEIGFLCVEKDLWGMTRKLDLQVLKHGQGQGQTLWLHLGRFDLAAVATLRQRCCPGAAPFSAAVPKGVCETLGESIQAAASDPAPAHLDRYAEDVECYVARGVRYPAEWWDRLKAKDARGYFEEFLKQLRTPDST
jgi:hypothetical protein